MTCVALLRAINAGISLPMSDLRQIAADLGLANPRTYIASGNLLFDSHLAEPELKAVLEQTLSQHVGKTVAAMIRTGEELAAVVAANPFAKHPGNKVVAIFLDSAPPASALTEHKHLATERIALGTREIYVHYPDGQGTSRLDIIAARSGTARNMNTVTKLAELASDK
jgi:uncharacterized protein (DUF1697 family)